MRTLGRQAAVPAVCFRDASSHWTRSVRPASAVGAVASQARLTKMGGTACKSSAVSSGKQTGKWQTWSDPGVLTVLECEGLKLILNTWTPTSHCPPFPVHRFFTPLLVERLCGTRIETLAVIQRDIIASDCTQEPEVRSEIATSSQSLISYGNAAFRPAPAVLP